MPVLSPPISVERPKPGQGGGGVHPPAHGGGGDNSPGDGSFDYGRRLYRARLGLILALASITVLFVTITVVFVLLRHGSISLDPRTGVYVRHWVPIALPVRLLLLNTIVLVASTFTIEMARRSVPLGGKMLTPEQIGRTAVFLASEDANAITGQVLHVNGGSYMP